jgi:hypothetical protein
VLIRPAYVRIRLQATYATGWDTCTDDGRVAERQSCMRTYLLGREDQEILCVASCKGTR